MSQRLWEQLEGQLAIIWNGRKEEAPIEEPSVLPDRTVNEVVSDSAYEYEPLDISTSSIRLLELVPGTRQDDIVCRLFDCRLEEQQGAYEALSYVWGDTKELTPIRVNDKTLKIGMNLRTALSNIRKQDEPRIIWADAICINQSKADEKNHQEQTSASSSFLPFLLEYYDLTSFDGLITSSRDQIYRNAVRTLIWLGNGNPRHTKKAYDMLENLASVALFRRDSGLESVSAQQPAFINDVTLSLLDNTPLESPLFEKYKDDLSIIHIAGSAWWVRAWTIQEILLAKEALVLTGSYAMDWERFCTAIDYGLAIGIWNPVNLGLIVNPIVLPYVSMHALKKRRQTSKSTSSTTMSNAAMSRHLLELLLHCRSREATNPRDKVHSLLGLVPVQQSQLPSGNILGIEPDYAVSVASIFSHTTRQLIVQSGSLDVLGACLPGSTLEIPSWVPDWTMKNNVPRALMQDAFGGPRHSHATGATDDQQAFPRLLVDKSMLFLWGHEVTTITAVAPVLERLIHSTIEWEPLKIGDTLASRLALLPQVLSRLGMLYEWLARIVPQLAVYTDWEALAREVPPTNLQPVPPSPGDDSDPLAIYWQTLSAGALAPEGRAHTARLFYAWRANLKPISRMHRWQVDRVSRPVAFVGYISCTWRRYSEFARFLEMAYERRLGRGANGYLALLPAATEVGDEIILARGGRVPLVVRPVKGDGEYTLVGEAYVHGIMDGEGFDEKKCAHIKVH